MRAGILRHGSLVVRDLISAEHVARLVSDIDRAFAAKDAYDTDGESPWYVRFDPPEAEYMPLDRWTVESRDGVFAADSPRTLFDLIDAYQSAPVGRIVAEYLGERPAMSVKKTTLRRVTATTDTAWWHQDGQFLGRIGSLNIWLALSDCGVDAPSLDLVPRRIEEILETGTEGADLTWSIGQSIVDRAAGGPTVRPVFRPGDALLFDEMLVHRTGLNAEMSGTRYAIEGWFFAPSKFPEQQRLPIVF